jgi:5'-3' exonuclease
MKTLIIDGNNLIFRTYWVASLKSGNLVNPISLFLLSFKKLVKQFEVLPANIYVTWDRRLIKDKVNYRALLCPEYKGTRDHSNREELYKCCDNVRNILKTLGVKNMYPGILEADDVIYWLSKEIRGQKIIASADSDLHQLINDTTVVYDLNKKKELNKNNFLQLTGYKNIREYLTVKALVGDKSDNISGIPKCGVKTAKKMISNGLETLSETNQEIFIKNKKLISLEAGLQEHPEEDGIYRYQFKQKQSNNIKDFHEACDKFNLDQINNNIMEWEEMFFNKNIHESAANCIMNLLQSHDDT